MSKVVISLCAFVVLVLITPAANADPLVITSGTASISSTARISYNIFGQDFSFSGANGDSGNAPATGCHPCSSLNPVSLGGFFVGTSLGSGSAMLNGTTFNNVNFLGTFNLGGGPVFLTGTQDFTITVPFGFSGDISGCADSALTCLNQLFPSQQLVGQGLVTAVFTFSGTVNGVNIYDFKSLDYTFTSAAVPEPMTLTLLATGLIGVGAKLRSRNRRRSREL